MLDAQPVDVTVTPDPSKPVVNNKALPNTNDLPPQGIVETEGKTVAASAEDCKPTSATQNQGAELNLPTSSEESQSEEHSQDHAKKRVRTKNRARVKNRPERQGGPGYQPSKKQHKFQLNTNCVQCSDDMPLRKPDIIIPK